MGAILGLGVTHFPLLSAPDDHMSSILRYTLEDPAIPAELRDWRNWPAEMQAEWSNDNGRAAAAVYREKLLHGLRTVRAALDAFAPDAVVIWGDDQYENFHEDVVPPFCVLAYDGFVMRPWANISAKSMAGRPNVWNEPADIEVPVRGNRQIAKALVGGVIDEGFDLAYAYEPLHFPGLAHAFLNALLYLDYDRRGFPYPVIPMTINCYGRRLIGHRGTFGRLGNTSVADPPSPSPRRCFDIGRAIARVAQRSDWRIALIASSSWSHSFLVDKTYRLRPDIPSDRRLYDLLAAGRFAEWRNVTLAEVEDAGQQELLNWFPLMGAMSELNARLDWSEFVPTYVFASNKVAAIFEPVPKRSA